MSSFQPLYFVAEPHLLELSAEVLEERISFDENHLEELKQNRCKEEASFEEEIRLLQARRANMLARIDTESNTVKKRQHASLRALAHGRFKRSGFANLPWEYLVEFFHPATLLHDLSLINTFMRSMIVNPASGEPLCQPLSFRFDCARRVSKCVKKFRQSYTDKFCSTVLSVKQLGTAAYIIDTFGLGGGEKQEMSKSSMEPLGGGEKQEMSKSSMEPPSCLSLRVENMGASILNAHNIVEIQFLGPHCQYERSKEVTSVIFQNLGQFMFTHNNPLVLKAPYEDIFDRIAPNHVTKYLKSFQEGLCSRTLRTYNASVGFQQELDALHAKLQVNTLDHEDEKVIRETYQRANNYITRYTHARDTMKGVDHVDPRILVAFSKRLAFCSDDSIIHDVVSRCAWAQVVCSDWQF